MPVTSRLTSRGSEANAPPSFVYRPFYTRLFSLLARTSVSTIPKRMPQDFSFSAIAHNKAVDSSISVNVHFPPQFVLVLPAELFREFIVANAYSRAPGEEKSVESGQLVWWSCRLTSEGSTGWFRIADRSSRSRECFFHHPVPVTAWHDIVR